MISQPNKASELAADLADVGGEESSIDPKEKRKYSFRFSHQGKYRLYAGACQNQILTPNQKIQVGSIRARLTGNVPWEALDPYTRELTERIAHLTISLVKRPDWAKEIGDIIEEDVIHALYKEVSAHEDTFQRPRADPETGAGAGSGGDGSASKLAEAGAPEAE